MSKQLYRFSDHKIIGGVCAGVADYFGADVTIVRIIWLLAAFAGFGILAYIVCWIIMPKEDSYEAQGASSAETKPADKEKSKQLIGITLIIVGVLFLMQRFFRWFDMSVILPTAIIILGLYILWGAGREKS